MATKKAPVNSKLLEAITTILPANPAMTRADLSFLRGLRRRGYTTDEIIRVGQKAGFIVTSKDLIVAPKKPKNVAVAAPVSQARPMQPAQR